MSKKASAKPTSKKSADDRVSSRQESPAEPVPMKRLTIDVPVELHSQIKVQCAREGVKMADAIRELLRGRFADAD